MCVYECPGLDGKVRTAPDGANQRFEHVVFCGGTERTGKPLLFSVSDSLIVLPYLNPLCISLYLDNRGTKWSVG